MRLLHLPAQVTITDVIRKYILALLLFFFLFYWTFSLHHLTIVPQVQEDEPWQASTGWKLATEGVFGSDMFSGFYGMERHYYGYMPIHPFLLAAVFRGAGLGLFQARFETVTMGLLTLALTYALGRRLFGPQVGLLAVFFLLFVRLTGLAYNRLTGIVLLDMGRIARYDMVVPVFGLAALHLYLSARQYRSNPTLYALAGLAAALAGLSHLYGVFWLVALGILAIGERAGWRNLLALGAGFAIPWLFYGAYVLNDTADWIGQTRGYGARFELLNPQWYWINLLEEARRYNPGLGQLNWRYVLRPGFWFTLVVLPVSLLALANQATRFGNQAARTLLVPAIVLPLLFALLISLKLPNYLVTIVPLVMLVMAWGVVFLWEPVGVARFAKSRHNAGRLLRGGLVLVLVFVTTEGVSRMRVLQAAATTTAPYANFIAQVRSHVPPGSSVLGLQNYWLGFEAFEYRAWPVPLGQADPRFWFPARPLAEALDEVDPDVILLDARMRAYFDTAADDPRPQAALDWMADRGYERMAVVEDVTYGRMDIYWVEGD